MKQLSVLIGTFCMAATAHAAPLAALLTFESSALTADGVKKNHFQESMIRDQNVIWTECVVPKNTAKHDDEVDDHGHEHNMNFALAGKWLVKGDKNQI